MPDGTPPPADYLDELRALANYQARQGGVVTFQLRSSLDFPGRFCLYVFRAAGLASPPDWPLVIVDSIEPLVVWVRARYVRVNTGGLTPYAATFRLTRDGMRAARRDEHS